MALINIASDINNDESQIKNIYEDIILAIPKIS